MFDVAPTELLMVAVVALVVIGPKDLPRTMRMVGRWVAKAQGVARHFRSGFDEMVRQAELDEMEKKWAEENARIMREHPASPAAPSWDDPPAMTPLPEAGAEAAPPEPPLAPSPGDDAPLPAVIAFPADPARSSAAEEPQLPLDPPAEARR